MSLRYRPFDADNHYYESLDSFTRYQPPAMKRRGVQILREGTRAFVDGDIRKLMRDNVRQLLGDVAVSD